ncbi:MAG TPA: hypothetical protein PL165_07535 [Methanofastidiosum sp.]|nr:hypothetical protein [Methanofastidiosum sp.]
MADAKEYQSGFHIEQEHKATYQWLARWVNAHGQMPSEREFYLHIVDDHLREDPNYYEKLKSLTPLN